MIVARTSVGFADELYPTLLATGREGTPIASA